jgi:peptidoglycan hydrolase-like protein with peptidoglycan-binding domain
MAYSSSVAKAQEQLNDLGYKGANGLRLVVDGLWGKNTSHAVLSFQKNNIEISNTGKLDSNTIKVLNYKHSQKIVPTSAKSVASKPVPTAFRTSGSKFDISKLMQNKPFIYGMVGLALIAILYPVIIKGKRRA